MVTALPHFLPGALASLLVAVARAAEAGEAVAVDVTVSGDAATVVARRTGAPSGDGGGTFAAEWLGGLGFSLPLARAVIAGGGGERDVDALGRWPAAGDQRATGGGPSAAVSLSTTAPVDASR